MINCCIPDEEAVVPNRENNLPLIQTKIATSGYTQLFTSFEIGISKQFKDNIFVHQNFTDRLYLLTINKIHLTKKRRKRFWLLHAKKSKIRKRISCQVFLLGVSATLTKQLQNIIVKKARSQPDYRLMQTLLNRLKIMQIYYFIKHLKSNCLDL